MSFSSDREAAGPEIQLRSITREAEKMFEALSRTDQERVRKVVAQPPPRHRCEKVKAQTKEGVYHFAAGESLRISFCQRSDIEACIVHIGTHTEFDRFAKHYSGLKSDNIIALEESSLMAKSPTASMTNQSHILKDRISDMSKLLADDLCEVIAQAQETLRDEIESACVKPIKETVQKLEQSLAESTKKSENGLAQLRGDTHDVDTRLSQRIDHAEKVCRELASHMQGLATDLSQYSDASTQKLSEVRNELMELGKSAVGLRQELQAGLDRLAAEHDGHRQKAEQQWQVAGNRLEDTSKRLEAAEQQSQQANCRFQAIESRLQAVDQQLAEIAAAAQPLRDGFDQWRTQVETQLATLEKSLQSFRGQLTQGRDILAEVQSRQEQLAAAVGQLAQQVAELLAARNRRWGNRLRAWWDAIRRRVAGTCGMRRAPRPASCISQGREEP